MQTATQLSPPLLAVLIATVVCALLALAVALVAMRRRGNPVSGLDVINTDELLVEEVRASGGPKCLLLLE